MGGDYYIYTHLLYTFEYIAATVFLLEFTVVRLSGGPELG